MSAKEWLDAVHRFNTFYNAIPVDLSKRPKTSRGGRPNKPQDYNLTDVFRKSQSLSNVKDWVNKNAPKRLPPLSIKYDFGSSDPPPHSPRKARWAKKDDNRESSISQNDGEKSKVNRNMCNHYKKSISDLPYRGIYASKSRDRKSRDVHSHISRFSTSDIIVNKSNFCESPEPRCLPAKSVLHKEDLKEPNEKSSNVVHQASNVPSRRIGNNSYRLGSISPKFTQSSNFEAIDVPDSNEPSQDLTREFIGNINDMNTNTVLSNICKDLPSTDPLTGIKNTRKDSYEQRRNEDSTHTLLKLTSKELFDMDPACNECTKFRFSSLDEDVSFGIPPWNGKESDGALSQMNHFDLERALTPYWDRRGSLSPTMPNSPKTSPLCRVWDSTKDNSQVVLNNRQAQVKLSASTARERQDLISLRFDADSGLSRKQVKEFHQRQAGSSQKCHSVTYPPTIIPNNRLRDFSSYRYNLCEQRTDLKQNNSNFISLPQIKTSKLTPSSRAESEFEANMNKLTADGVLKARLNVWYRNRKRVTELENYEM